MRVDAKLWFFSIICVTLCYVPLVGGKEESRLFRNVPFSPTSPTLSVPQESEKKTPLLLKEKVSMPIVKQPSERKALKAELPKKSQGIISKTRTPISWFVDGKGNQWIIDKNNRWVISKKRVE